MNQINRLNWFQYKKQPTNQFFFIVLFMLTAVSYDYILDSNKKQSTLEFHELFFSWLENSEGLAAVFESPWVFLINEGLSINRSDRSCNALTEITFLRLPESS